MKFTTAVGILVAQSTRPTVSDDSRADVAGHVMTLLPGDEGHDGHHDLDLPEEILSRAVRSVRLKGLNMKNTLLSSTTITNCDPLSAETDVGVLGCSPGYECVPHESSSLGGHCVANFRELQDVEFCDLCGYGSTVGYSKYTLPTGYQGSTCGDLAFESYGDNTTLTAEQCEGNAQLAKSADCCVSYDCNPCGDKIFNGNLTVLGYIPCGALASLLNETICAAFTEYLSPYCCEVGVQAVEFCDLCGYGSTVGYSKFALPTGYQGSSCGDLAFESYGDNVTLTAEQCEGTAQLAKSADCCVSYDCSPCGDKMFIGNLTFGDAGYSCGAIVPLLNETVCANYTEYLSNYCCQDGEDMLPTMAPAVPDATDGPVRADSATMWTMSTSCISLLGLSGSLASSLLIN